MAEALRAKAVIKKENTAVFSFFAERHKGAVFKMATKGKKIHFQNFDFPGKSFILILSHTRGASRCSTDISTTKTENM